MTTRRGLFGGLESGERNDEIYVERHVGAVDGGTFGKEGIVSQAELSSAFCMAEFVGQAEAHLGVAVTGVVISILYDKNAEIELERLLAAIGEQVGTVGGGLLRGGPETTGDGFVGGDELAAFFCTGAKVENRAICCCYESGQGLDQTLWVL